jgi:serine/threonine protein kinase
MNQVQPCKAAVPLIAHMRELWQQGQPVDAQAVLDHYPELADNGEVVLDLAFEEFCLRQAQGEALDPAAFASRFAICEQSLRLTLECCDFVADDKYYLLRDKHTIPWPEPGKKLLGFELLRPLGQGSFARVYLGRETALGNRLVVLKVSREESAEAEILGRLRHDNIVPVYSIQKDPQTGFSVVCMPFLGKTTLHDVLKNAFAVGLPRLARVILDTAQPDSPEEKEVATAGKILLHGSYVNGVVEMGVQLADALAFVHERFIYHRDLKPSNILVRPDGGPMLLDFNLSFDQRIKDKGVGGTLQYMAPEHLRATDREYKGLCIVDGRSDLFSLGVILYELLAGKHPFGPIPEKGTEREIRSLVQERHQQGYAPLQKTNPAVDSRLAQIVDKCLTADPARRYQTARELVRALRNWSTPAQRLLRRIKSRPRIVAAVGTALEGFAIVFFAFLAMRAPYPVRQYQEGVKAYQDGDYARAVEHMDRSLAEGESVQAYLVRGRAHLKLGKKQLALEDFNTADLHSPSGLTKAALAYCLTRQEPPKFKPAVFLYEKAIEKGLVSSEVYQSLGYCLMQIRGGDRKALAALKKAIELDPNNQMAYYHRAYLDVQIVLGRNPGKYSLTQEGLAALGKAFALGPATASMHLEAARHYVLASSLEPRWAFALGPAAAVMHLLPANLEPRWRELALDHLRQAIQGGIKSDKAKTYLKRWLEKDPGFLEFQIPSGPAPLVTVQAIQDPLRDFPPN